MRYKNLIIIGTSHIAKQSLDEVKNTITKQKPEIVALELDRKRFYALTHEQKRKLKISDIRKMGFKGFLFNLIGAWVEEKLGKMVGAKPGSEMITAIKLTKKLKLKIALIDQDIEITMKRLSKELTWKEKGRFLIDIIKSVIFRKSELKELGIKKLDLTKVPSKTLIKKLIKRVKKRYPNFYKVLVEERNQIMANNLVQIMQQNPDKQILAIIGAGHEDEILYIIKKQIKSTISYSYNVNVSFN